MHPARTTLRRLVASLMLAVMAVFAVLTSAHAGLHASGHPHGAAMLHAGGEAGPTSLHGSDLAGPGETALPDTPDCSCCHAAASALAPDLAVGLVPRGPGRGLPDLAAAAPPSTPPEGLRRPPRRL